jgi:hypothetical protein
MAAEELGCCKIGFWILRFGIWFWIFGFGIWDLGSFYFDQFLPL